jgi:head-tail adaptor
MSVPRLNRLLTLESPARVADGAGGFLQSWTALGEHWAQVTARTGRETQVAAVAVSTVPYTIVLRAAPVGHPARPVPEQRFREGSRVFHIRSVAEADPEARYLVCMADEEVVR